MRPATIAPPSVAEQPSDEASSYQIEIDNLARRAKINGDTGRQMRDMGAPDRAVELLQEASRMIAASRCLHDQMSRRVPFYQGKATCAAAVPTGS